MYAFIVSDNGKRDSPRQSYMCGANGNNLHRLSPEFVLPSNIYRVNHRKAIRDLQIHPGGPDSIIIFMVTASKSKVLIENFCTLVPCQKMKFLDSAWQAEIGG